MTTSRTGTTAYKQWRRRVLQAGQARGITRCPDCGITLDYQHSRQPNSAEPDHITPWTRGGLNTIDNGRVICRRCNQSRGNRPIQANKPKTNTHPTPSTGW